MRGIIDEILFLEDGSAAPLDYKFVEYKDRTIKSHRYHLTFCAQLIRGTYQVQVNRGFIVYTRTRNKLVEVPITDNMYDDLEKIISDLLEIVARGIYPKPTHLGPAVPIAATEIFAKRLFEEGSIKI